MMELQQWKVLGHPVHSPLTHFPLALWTAGFLGDLVHAWKGNIFWWDFAFWNIALGLGLGTLTLATGFYDYLFVPVDKPGAERIATFHMLVMLGAASFFGASLYFHTGGEALVAARQVPALVLSGLGTACLQGGGWLGGQLVHHYGIGYDARDPEPNRKRP